jgi:hypothetical protein
MRGTHLYKVNPLHVIIQSIIGLAAGAIGAAIVDNVNFFFFYFLFLGAGAYGGAVAELMLKAIGRKHGRIVEWVGGISVFAGGLVLIAVYMFMFQPDFRDDIIDLVAVGIAAGTCFSRLKYF